MFFILIIFIYSFSIFSQDFDENSFFPQLPTMDKEFENARYQNSVLGWQEEIQENFINISTIWNEEVDNRINEYLNSITTSDFVNSMENYKMEFYNYAESLKEKLYTEWKEEVYQKVLNEGMRFFEYLTNKNIESNPDNNDINNYYIQLQSLENNKIELLGNVLQTDSLYENNYNQIINMEANVRESIFSLSDNLREYLLKNDLYYELDTNGIRKTLILPDKTSKEILNTSGKRLSDILSSIEKAKLENLSLESISKELEVFLKEESINALKQKVIWDNKTQFTYSNNDSSLILPLYNKYYPDEYYNNPWIIAIKNYNSNSAELRNLIQTNLLSANLKLETIFQADLIAETPNPELQWNTNPFFPVSEIGGRYSTQGDFFKYYYNHQLICWGYCLPYDMLRNEEYIKFEVNFSVIDINSKKNSKLWDNFAIQMNNNSLDWKNSYIPAIQSWEEKKNNFTKQYDTWKITSENLKSSINLEFTKKTQELSMNGNEFFPSNSNNEKLNLNKYIEEITSKEKENIIFPESKSLEFLNENIATSLEGIRNLSLFTVMSDTAINSRQKYMENMKDIYSQEKVFDGSVKKEVIDNFLEGGICFGSNFNTNSDLCTGLINTFGVKKYESVVLDENLNLIFTKKIFSGDVLQIGINPTIQDSFKMGTDLVSFKALAPANIELSSNGSIDLFSVNSLETISSEIQKVYSSISNMKMNENHISQINESLSTLSSKNATLALGIINEKIAAATLIESLATSLFNGGTVKEWINSMIVSKVGEAICDITGWNKDLLVSYYTMKKNQSRLNKMNNSLTGGILPISVVLPIIQLGTNLAAEVVNYLSDNWITAYSPIYTVDNGKRLRENKNNNVKHIRFKEYDKLKSVLDYKSQYKASFKEASYDFILKNLITDPSIDSNQISKILQYLDKKKEEKKKEKEEENKRILMATQVITELLVSFVFPPAAFLSAKSILFSLASATVQAGIASSMGNENVTAGTFITALAGGLFRNFTLPLKSSQGIVSNMMKFGVSLSYTPKEKMDTLGDLLSITDPGIKTGWSAGIHLGLQGIKDPFGLNVGVNTSPEGISSSLGVNFNQSGFIDLSNSNIDKNLGLTLGAGDKYGNSLGVVLNSVIPSSLFLSMNPDKNNPLGIGSTISVNSDGTSSIGIDLAKIEALTSTYSSSTGWSKLEANSTYQAEINKMNSESDTYSDSDKNDNNTPEATSLVFLYGLMGLLGFTKSFNLRNTNSEKTTSSENSLEVSIKKELEINCQSEISAIQLEISNLEKMLSDSKKNITLSPLLVSLPVNPLEADIKILYNKLLYLMGFDQSTPNTNTATTPPTKDYIIAKETAIKSINGNGSVMLAIESFSGNSEEKEALKKEVFEEILKQNNPSLLKVFLSNKYYSAIHPTLLSKINSLNSVDLSSSTISSAGISYATNFQQGSSTSLTSGALAFKQAGIEFFEKGLDLELRKIFKESDTISSYSESGKPTKYYKSEDYIEIMKKYSLGDIDKSAPNGNSYYKQAQSSACPLFTTYGIICSLYEKSGKTPIPTFADFLFKGIVNKIISPQPNHLDSMSRDSSLKMVKVFGLEGIKIAEPSSNVKHGDNSAPPTLSPSLQIERALDKKYPVLNVRRDDNRHTFMAELSSDGKNYIVVNTTNDPKSGTILEPKDIYYILGYN